MCVGHNQATTGKHCTRASSATNAPCKHDVFKTHNMVTSDLVYTYKIVNGLFSHGLPAQVPNVCNDAGVTDASILSGHPDTASSLCYVAWHVVRFVYDVSVCLVKETLRQGLDRSCSWINQPEDLTSRKLLRVCPGRNPATFRLMAPGCDCWVAAELLDSPHSPVRQRRR
jgi:hypothetical protein